MTVQNSVTNVFISPSTGGEDLEIDLSINPIGKLDITYDPPDANVGTDLTLTSSDTDIATVNNSGEVEGHKVGETTITAHSSARGGIDATVKVRVVATPTEITLNKTSLTLDKSTNNSETLSATISPSYANKDTDITWTSSNSNVATVSSSGLVTGVSNGTATITVTTKNGKTASCNVTIQTTPTSVSLNKTSATLDLSGTKTVQLTATINPTTANVSNGLTWSSSDSSVATVSTGGLVTGVKNGTATITLKTANGKTATCSITVQTNPTSVVLNKTSATIDLSTSTKTVQLSATINPSSSNINNSLTWSSSNTSVATVSSSGLVTGASNGTATITVKTANGKTATCSIVVNTTITSLTVSPTSATIDVGATKQLTCTKSPTSTNEGVTWSSSNTSVATVDNNGLVTAKGSGKATITVKNASATKSATCEVTCLGKYTITYNANGGSGAPGNQTKTEGVNLTLSSTKPTRTDFVFQGWATSASGSVAYAPGATYSTNANLNLYAVWSVSTVTMSGSWGRADMQNGDSGFPVLASNDTSEAFTYIPKSISVTTSATVYGCHYARSGGAFLQGKDSSGNWVTLKSASCNFDYSWFWGTNSTKGITYTYTPTQAYKGYRLKYSIWITESGFWTSYYADSYITYTVKISF